jgi:hypothetical protein
MEDVMGGTCSIHEGNIHFSQEIKEIKHLGEEYENDSIEKNVCEMVNLTGKELHYFYRWPSMVLC